MALTAVHTAGAGVSLGVLAEMGVVNFLVREIAEGVAEEITGIPWIPLNPDPTDLADPFINRAVKEGFGGGKTPANKSIQEATEQGIKKAAKQADEAVDLSKVKLRKVMEGADDWRVVFYDNTNIGNVIVSDGGTRLELDIIIPKELRGKGVGKEVFRQSIETFDPIDIKATWKADPVKYADSGGMSDNLAVFLKNRAIIGDEAAALSTPTGKIASDFGFNKVANINEDIANGNMVIQLIFHK